MKKLVTVSSGNTATGFSDITLYSKSRLKSFKYEKLSDETLPILRNKCRLIFKSFGNRWNISDRKKTSGHFDLGLKAIMQNSLPFGGVSLLVVGDFFRLQPINQKSVFMKSSESYIGHSVDGYVKTFNCMSWLRLLSRPVIQFLLNYLRGLEKVSKQIMMQFK